MLLRELVELAIRLLRRRLREIRARYASARGERAGDAAGRGGCGGACALTCTMSVASRNSYTSADKNLYVRCAFSASTCTNLAFVTQVTLLASECWYFVVSLDVVTDLFFSPFNR